MEILSDTFTGEPDGDYGFETPPGQNSSSAGSPAEKSLFELCEAPYYRKQAVRYADYWAYRRNPRYISFDDLGGDCTNFVSQALYYANGVMNFTPVYGWYYLNLNERAPSWTGVEFLWNFLTSNRGSGPYGHEIPLSLIQPGDIVQLVLDGDTFNHCVMVTRLLNSRPDPETILIAAHDNNAACRPLATYSYSRLRAVHIDGVRYLAPITGQPEKTLSRPSGPVQKAGGAAEDILAVG